MRKIQIMTILSLCIMFLSSCSANSSLDKDATDDVKEGVSTLFNGINENMNEEYCKIYPEEYGKMITNKLIQAFEENDKEKIKQLFSQKSIKECVDFDEYLDSALKYYNTKNTKIVFDNPSESSERIDGKKVICINQMTNVSTNNDEFLFYVRAYPVDETDPSNVGIWSLCISNVKYIGSKHYEDITNNMVYNSGIFVVPENE